jgi:hypothetical protein
MKQAALFDGFAFDPFSFQHDDVAAPKVDVGGSEIADAFVVVAMVVVIDERRDFLLEITRLGLPQIKSEHNDGAVRPGSDGR